MSEKKKYIIIISIILIVILGLSLVIYNFYKGYKEDKIKTQQIIEIINSNYEIFINDLYDFNSQRDDIYNKVFKDNYYEKFQENINNWNLLMQNYRNLVLKIDQNSNKLKDCTTMQLYNPEINRKCEIFIESYEVLINSYISDINLYNQNINSYNKWVQSNPNYQAIEMFKEYRFVKYIDFNNDGVFVGKE